MKKSAGKGPGPGALSSTSSTRDSSAAALVPYDSSQFQVAKVAKGRKRRVEDRTCFKCGVSDKERCCSCSVARYQGSSIRYSGIPTP